MNVVEENTARTLPFTSAFAFHICEERAKVIK